jgi:hypothetical protein
MRNSALRARTRRKEYQGPHFFSVRQAQQWNSHLVNEGDEGVTKVFEVPFSTAASDMAQYQETRSCRCGKRRLCLSAPRPNTFDLAFT